MPSTNRPSPCNGCGRRTFSKRRTNSSSVASRNSTLGSAPRRRNAESAPCRSEVKPRLRTSTTAAILLMAPPLRVPSSTIVSSRPGGRLSTTNQPRSSRHFAAVLRPAPDSPVNTTSCSGSCPVGSGDADSVTSSPSPSLLPLSPASLASLASLASPTVRRPTPRARPARCARRCRRPQQARRPSRRAPA